MADTVSVEFALTCEVTRTLDVGLDNVAANPPYKVSMGADNGVLNVSSTPAVTQEFSDNLALAAGAGALDLTSLAGPNGSTDDFTGLKVQVVKLKTPPSNTVSIIVEHKDGATGYNLFGDDNASDESIEVPPGTKLEFIYNDKLENVDGTHKDIKFTGNGTETINVMLVAG